MHTPVVVKGLNEAIYVKYFKKCLAHKTVFIYYFRNFVNIYANIVVIRKHHVVEK